MIDVILRLILKKSSKSKKHSALILLGEIKKVQKVFWINKFNMICGSDF